MVLSFQFRVSHYHYWNCYYNSIW